VAVEVAVFEDDQRRHRRPWTRPGPRLRAPTLFVFSWDINTRWELETDPDKTSEVAVTFTAEAPDRTRW
jgi:hypothetical protein